MGIQAAVRKLANDSGFDVVDTSFLPGRKPSYAEVPNALDRRIVDLLKTRYQGGLYSHQTIAIELVVGGENLCLATSTASGKSLVFQTAALDMLLRDRFARVIALYPAKALIQDQIEKWRPILDPFGIRFGFVDGTVPVERRADILSSSRVVLMTPDVMHAWLMARVGERPVRDFLRGLRLLILDEAHVYDGVFGTNMAYLLRRLESLAAPHRLIASTATIGDPSKFISQLTGRKVAVIGAHLDGSASPDKTLFRVKASAADAFESAVDLLVALSTLEGSRFIAFGDSRKMIERVVAATLRVRKPPHGNENSDAEGGDDPDADVAESLVRILPYRAGYEPCDREQIQRALSTGTLSGVVSTSALEMGIDIGEIDTVVMLGAPQNVKSFWQRLGRAGRRREAVCLVIDNEGTMGNLEEYLKRPIEPSWLYLENRYIQYANALCAAAELSAFGKVPTDEAAFASLPQSFVPLVENELNPVDIVPNDLYPLKQRAQSGPHREFPLRTATEQEFKVSDGRSPLGTLSLAQTLREAYPGAVHYYMAQPYRVFGFTYRTGDIRVKRCRHWTTRPQAQSVVFPRFQGGVLNLLRSDTGMVAEVELQVSERVLGFVEQRGKVRSEHTYRPGSEYYQKPITRFFETTGVCWYFPDRFTTAEGMAERLLEAFCVECGIQARDVGIAPFRAASNPHAPAATDGICIYDATNGSLRLTQMLGARFAQVVLRARTIAEEREEGPGPIAELRTLAKFVDELQQGARHEVHEVPLLGSEWATVVACGQRAIYNSPDGPIEVTIVGYRYTPQGLMYELTTPKPGSRWFVATTAVRPVNGQTATALYNVMTGDVRDERNAA